MMQFTTRPSTSVAAPPSDDHSSTGTSFLSPYARELIYEQMPLGGRPLSYPEILRGWMQAVVKKQHAVDSESLEVAEDEYEDYASDIIAVVGQDQYNEFLEKLLDAIKQRECSASSHLQGCGDL